MKADDAPEVLDLAGYCVGCKSEVRLGLLLVNAPVSVAIAWMKAMRCPNCDADYRELRTK